MIEAAGLITDPPSAVPFLRAFFDKGVAALLAQNQGRLRIPLRKRPEAATADPATPDEPAQAG
jgi:predicted methyltransferase